MDISIYIILFIGVVVLLFAIGESIRAYVYKCMSKKELAKEQELISSFDTRPMYFEARPVYGQPNQDTSPSEPPDMSNPIDRAIYEELTRAQRIEQADREFVYPPYFPSGKRHV